MAITRILRLAMAALICSAFATTAAVADPPERVARLAQMRGEVSFSPSGEDDWVAAETNRPMITGDRLWADAGGRAELEMGSIAARAGSETSVTVLNLDDTTVQLELTQGTLNVRVRALDSTQVVEVDTPNIAFVMQEPGSYRIDVYADGSATLITVRSGSGEAFGDAGSYAISASQAYQFVDAGTAQYAALPSSDEFDRWCADLDRREQNSIASRYVSTDVIGYADLDGYGNWSSVPEYGNVWIPTAVAADWVPYRSGRWAWIEPWGWTWVDEAPWGFAPFHYGRWAHLNNRWCWVPGPIRAHPVYAPALVAFIGDGNLRLTLRGGGAGSGIGWFPLGPGEVYRPAYNVSRNYFTRVNTSGTNISVTYITNVYNNVNAPAVVYRNRDVAGAVTAVPTAAFLQSRPVRRDAIALTRDQMLRQPVSSVAAIAPSRASVIAGGTTVGGDAAAIALRPSAAAMNRRVIARHTPPPEALPFATRQKVLERDPGKPPDAAALTSLRPVQGAGAQTPRARTRMVTPERTRLAVPVPAGSAASSGNGAGMAMPKGSLPKPAEASTSGPITTGSPGAPLERQKRAPATVPTTPPPNGPAQSLAPPSGPVPNPPAAPGTLNRRPPPGAGAQVSETPGGRGDAVDGDGKQRRSQQRRSDPREDGSNVPARVDDGKPPASAVVPAASVQQPPANAARPVPAAKPQEMRREPRAAEAPQAVPARASEIKADGKGDADKGAKARDDVERRERKAREDAKKE